MAVADQTFYQESYNASFENGMQVGNFPIPGSIGRGIQVGNSVPYVFTPVAGGLISTAVIDGTSGFIPLSGVEVETPGATKLKPLAQNNEYVLVLDCPRLIQVSSDVPITVNFSGYTRYFEKFYSSIVSELDDANYVAEINLAPAMISSIEVICTHPMLPLNLTVNLLTNDTYELPYTDLGLNIMLESFVGIDANNNPTLGVVSGETTPLTFVFDLDNYQHANWLTPITINSGSPRPLVKSPVSAGQLSFTQIVYPLGDIPDILQVNMDGKDISKGEHVYGIPVYSDGFTSWKG